MSISKRIIQNTPYSQTREFSNFGQVVVHGKTFVYGKCFTERHTPLSVFYEMVSTNNMDMVKYLIDSGLVNIDDVDKEKLFSLLWSMKQSVHKDCEKLFAEYFLNFESIRSYIFYNRKRYPAYIKMVDTSITIPKHRFSGSGAVLK